MHLKYKSLASPIVACLVLAVLLVAPLAASMFVHSPAWLVPVASATGGCPGNEYPGNGTTLGGPDKNKCYVDGECTPDSSGAPCVAAPQETSNTPNGSNGGSGGSSGSGSSTDGSSNSGEDEPIVDSTDPAANGGNCPEVKNCDLVTKYINPFVNLLAALVGVAVTISIIIGGIQYGSSAGDPQAVTAAKNRIRNAIIALITFVFLWALLNFLIPGGLL